MELSLYNLKPTPKSKKRKKRVGRGNSSGHGNYSTRGMKGQRARSGGRGGLKLLGIKSTLNRIPKLKGFRSIHPKPQIVNLLDLEKRFKDDETVNAKSLLEKGLIMNSKRKIKVLGKGKLTKKLTVKLNDFSESAKEAIEKAGGQAIKI
ncbi:MAG: large subunit ribosomal protein L15 [Parcubacteria group bacterium Athens1014_10]|nr:MAG: large subunit ribosomal protein L15 [Parcubacteria group bacterium Athens1014_10]TSD05481.1 MAG: large subunit ribosomal protein L15 [Parcubacteria group bacterium Athens0714_12]